MKNICIAPIDDSIRDRANAVRILNNYKSLGFDTRSGFVGLVQENLPKYKGYKEQKPIEWFWESRRFDAELNTELEILLESLKNE